MKQHDGFCSWDDSVPPRTDGLDFNNNDAQNLRSEGF